MNYFIYWTYTFQLVDCVIEELFIESISVQMKQKMASDITVTSPDMADSETESLIVHTTGDATVDDLMSENDFETDVEIETIDANSETSSLKLEPRAKTRLLSRSHSVSDLKNQTDNYSEGLKIEPPRRNSSGEYSPLLYDSDAPTPKPSPNLLQDLDLTRYKGSQQHRSSLTPTSSLLQLSPVNVHYSSLSWKPPQTQEKEDNFSVLLQTTAERVLTKLKSRQQDLGGNITRQKSQRKPSHTLQPCVPRKLQPLMRDGSKTPRPESDLRSLNGDSDFGPLSAA